MTREEAFRELTEKWKRGVPEWRLIQWLCFVGFTRQEALDVFDEWVAYYELYETEEKTAA